MWTLSWIRHGHCSISPLRMRAPPQLLEVAKIRLLTAYICFPLSLIGFMLNVVMLKIFIHRTNIRPATGAINILISIINLILLVMYPLYWQTYGLIISSNSERSDFTTNAFVIALFVLRILFLLQTWFFVLTTVERLLCVQTRRLKLVRWWTWQRLLMSIPFLIMMAAGAETPKLFHHGLLYEDNCLYPKAKINGIIGSALEIIYSCVIPLLCQIGLSARAEIKLKRQKALLITTATARYDKAIKSLRLMTATYVICFIPNGLTELSIIIGYLESWTGRGAFILTAAMSALTGVATNWSALANFLVYFLISSGFRQDCVRILKRMNICTRWKKSSWNFIMFNIMFNDTLVTLFSLWLLFFWKPREFIFHADTLSIRWRCFGMVPCSIPW